MYLCHHSKWQASFYGGFSGILPHPLPNLPENID
jgi:hypothetical protein